MTVDDDRHPADLTLVEALALLRTGALTAERLTTAVLERIDERNGGEPSFDGSPDAVNAWTRVHADRALERARVADARRASGHGDPLGGLPIAIKDLIGIAGLPLTASSRHLEGHVADRDSAAWRALEAAGAVLVGQTHTHEFAAGGTTDQVGNPWALSCTSGGSSGGSAAAIAAGMVPAALGTDTAGSVRIPASLSGISSFKGGYGRVATDGVLPLAWSLDHVGPMAHTLEDCALLDAVLRRAVGSRNPWGVGMRGAGMRGGDAREGGGDDGAPIAAPADLRGRRIAVTDRPDRIALGPGVRAGLERARAALESLGAQIVELAAPPDLDRADFDTIFLAEARAAHARYAAHPERYRPSTRAFLAPGETPITAEQYLHAQRTRIRATDAWAEWFRGHRIDATLEPTTGATAPPRGDGYDADREIGGDDPLTFFTATWNATGFPVAAFPVGLDDRGLPVGMSLAGGPDTDDVVLGTGIALQRVLAPLGPAPWNGGFRAAP